MNVKYINPFLKATTNVLKTTMAFTDTSAAKSYLKKDQMAGGDISGVIGITDETEGSLFASFNEACIYFIVSNMFGETVKSILQGGGGCRERADQHDFRRCPP